MVNPRQGGMLNLIVLPEIAGGSVVEGLKSRYIVAGGLRQACCIFGRWLSTKYENKGSV